MSAEYTLRKKLNNIIDWAYGKEVDPTMMYKFKNYDMEISTKQRRSKNGHYEIAKSKIVLFNIDHIEANNVEVLIHELAHHIDYCLHEKTGHQKPFYEAFTKLLYAAFDLGYTTPEAVNNMEYVSRCHNKVLKIVAKYDPNPQKFIDNRYTIKVKAPKKVAKFVSAQGYFYNQISKTYDKNDVTRRQVYYEVENISRLGVLLCDISVIGSHAFDMNSHDKPTQFTMYGTQLR